MVDNRAAGFYGIGGAFNFKSGDISGTAAKTNDDKYGPGTEYAPPEDNEDENDSSRDSEKFTDRSAQLRATLNSLAMMNVASVIKSKTPKKDLKEKDELLEDAEIIIPKEPSKKKNKNKDSERKKKSKSLKSTEDIEENYY